MSSNTLRRSASIVAGAALTVGALSGSATSASAGDGEFFDFETATVTASLPGGGVEKAVIDVPENFDRIRVNPSTVRWTNAKETRHIRVQLNPRTDTIKKLKDERKKLADRLGGYRDLGFRAFPKQDQALKAVWVYSYKEKVGPRYRVTEILKSHNRLTIIGKSKDRPALLELRAHAQPSFDKVS